MRRLLAFALFAACSGQPQKVSPVPPTAEPPAARPADPELPPRLDALRDHGHVKGWQVSSVCTDDNGRRVGARFVHDTTGFTLDWFQIETAPQGYIWVTTFPTSDMGEPHTQEHLLLGKGNRGRRFGSNEVMRLAASTAFTSQWHTQYAFNTIGGPDAYWDEFADQLDTLLHPDYTDEEIRREVRNFGIEKTGLEEKGTVYNEMVRAYEGPDAVVNRAIGQLVYGVAHPLSYEAGGYPEAIRRMTPADIRTYHHDHYTLGNMGLIAAYPSTMPLESVLARTDAILAKQGGPRGHVFTEAEMPAVKGAIAGSGTVVEFPDADGTGQGIVEIAWPATRNLELADRTLLGLFIDAFAGDEATPLYAKLIDGKRRVIDTGATRLIASVSRDQGQTVAIELDGVRPDHLDRKTLDDLRAIIAGELTRIAKLPDSDPELIAFDKRVKARVVAKRRSLARFMDQPPGFGERGEDDRWLVQVMDLAKVPGFEKSMTMKPALTAVEDVLAQSGNPWRDRIAKWGLLEKPYAAAAKPSPQLRKQLDDARVKRGTDELARLQAEYKTPDAAATLAKYQTVYDAATHELEASQAAVAMPPLVPSPPMTLDGGLKYETGELSGVRTFTATFDSMQSMKVDLAFDFASAVDPKDHMFLAGFPGLLSGSGVIVDGKPISAADMADRLRDELLAFEVRYIGNNRTLREELQLSGQGLGVGEAKRALEWIRRMMLAPDWRIENLPRLRDVVSHELAAQRKRMQDSEEMWVDDPRDAWWHQDALQAHTNSFLTQEWDLQRLAWMLADPGEAKQRADVIAQVNAIAAPAKRPQLVAAAQKLAASSSPVVKQLGADLQVLLAEIPDDSLAQDWPFVCRQFVKDFSSGAPAALKKLEAIRAQIVRAGKARIVVVGSAANEQAIAADLKTLVDAIPTTAPVAIKQAPKGQFRARVTARTKSTSPYVGLIAPSTSSGVHINLAPLPHYADTRDDSVLDYLASNLYTGHGAHSMFSQTWAAGLAYSNGLRPHIDQGYLEYYAERCPLLPTTLQFVIDRLRAAKPDENIARYAVASAFGSLFGARVSRAFEYRAEKMAADLVDGQPPDMVRAFRAKILELAAKPGFAKTLFDRMLEVYGHVLPGVGKLAPADVPFVIGNAKQLAAQQDYLTKAVGKSAQLTILYPRDFWIP
ncbi:MAG: hypothetical protein QM831_05930 [Kofleriaceae bacterium]